MVIFQPIATEYQSKGFTSVTIRNLRYRLSLFLGRGSMEMVTESTAPASQVVHSRITTISSLTGEETDNSDDDVGNEVSTDPPNDTLENNVGQNIGEKPKQLRLTKAQRQNHTY
jgi:hypothetical protein